MSTEVQNDLQAIRTRSPFPWRQEVNFDGRGGVRLIDAAGMEVPLLSITGLAVFITQKMAERATT